jgi:hypothetical protein
MILGTIYEVKAVIQYSIGFKIFVIIEFFLQF